MHESPLVHADGRTVGGLLQSQLGAAVVLFLAVFAACLFGICTRPVGFLASVWPANAIMLGLLLRVPAVATPAGWCAGAAAYLAADLLTGSGLLKALVLNAANLVGIAVACAVYARLPAETIRLRRPSAILYLLVAAAAAGATAGLVGGFANPLLFGGGVLSGWTFWFATELVNYIALLPVILAATPLRVERLRQLFAGGWLRRRDALPAAALVLSCGVAMVIGGPGAIAFPVPALLWCGLSYPVFPTTVVTLCFGVWAMAIISAGYGPTFASPLDEMALISIRLGASLIALAPIMLSSVTQSRNELLGRLHDLATRDALTGVDNRRAFLESAQRLLAKAHGPFAVLMIDIDHFKAVNDRYGHAGGDEVLVEFASRARNCLRSGDLLGRLGGEEFAVYFPDRSQDIATQVAERIREEIARAPVTLRDGRVVPVTASIGMVFVTSAEAASLDHLLAEADTALYLAKNNGRSRLESTIRKSVAVAHSAS